MNTENFPKIITLSIFPAVPAYFLGRLIIRLASSPNFIFIFLTDAVNIAKLFLILLLLGTLTIPILSIKADNQENRWLPIVVIIGSFALPQITLYPQGWLLLIISSLLFFLSVLRFRNAITSTIGNTIKIRGGKTFRTPIKNFYLIVAVITALSFSAGHTLKLQEKKTTLEMPERLLEKAVQPITPIIEQQVGSQLESIVGPQFEQKLNVSGSREILEFLKEESGETLEEGTVRQKLGLRPEQLEGIEITEQGNIDLSGALPGATALMQEKIEKALARYQKYVIVTLAVVLFLSIHFLSRLALIFCPPLVTILLAVLKKTGTIQVVTETVKAERFVL